MATGLRRALVAGGVAGVCVVVVALACGKSFVRRDALLAGPRFARAPPGDKGRLGGAAGRASRIQAETLKVIERADAAARQQPTARFLPTGMGRGAVQAATVPRMRDAVKVVKEVVDATAKAEDRREAREAAAQKTARDKAGIASAAAVSPKKWNWEQWQEQEKKDLLSSSALPTSAAAAERVAEKAAALKIAAAKADAMKVAEHELQVGAHARAGAKGALQSHSSHPAEQARAGESARLSTKKTLVHVAASAKVQAQSRGASTGDSAGLARKKALVHAAASAKAHAAQVHHVKLAGSAAARSQYQSKWNWAQWQDEAKQLLLHSHKGSSGARQQSSREPSNAAAPSSASPAARALPTGEKPPALRSLRSKEARLNALQKRVKKLEVVQQNAVALSKVAKQDENIRQEISSVMNHVSQVDKEKHAPTLSFSVHGKHSKNSFTRAGGKVVATSLSKSTLKAMKQAQLAGWAADNAAKARAKAAAAANYAKMRDEMFRKDAEKQVKDEQQLRAEQKEAREVGEATSHDDARLLHSLDRLNKGDASGATPRYAPRSEA